MSVDWAALSSGEDTLRDNDEWGLVTLTAELCWEQKQTIEHTPLPDNRAHCDIVGKKTTTVKRAFKEGAKWLRYPRRIE